MTSRYFTSRTDAGKMLAAIIAKDFKDKPCAIVALNEGGVMVGAQIAIALQSVLCLLLIESIALPAELDPIGAVNESGSFTYNKTYSAGQIEELMADYRGYVEDKKRSSMTEIHTLLGAGTGIRPALLRDKHIFLVSDGLTSGYSLDIAMEFLKPIKYREVIVATPLASSSAVSKMRLTGDKTYCLSVVDNYISTDHYYERKDVPNREDVVKVVEEIMERWPI